VESGQLEPLWDTEDSLVWQGNVRILVLEESGWFQCQLLATLLSARTAWLGAAARTLSSARLWQLRYGPDAAEIQRLRG
jgi:hypothetical protein